MRFIIVDSLNDGSPAVDCAGSVFWIVLEKFGFLDYRVTSLESLLSHSPTIPFVAIIPNAVARAISREQLDQLRDLETPSLLEGPLDNAHAKDVEIRYLEFPSLSSASIEIIDPHIRNAVESGIRGMSTPSNSGAIEKLEDLLVVPRVRRQQRQSAISSAFTQTNQHASKALAWAIPQTAFNTDTEGIREILRARSANAINESYPLLYQLGSLVVSTFEILNYILEDYTSSYLEDTYEFSHDRYPIEFVLITLLRRLLREACRTEQIEDDSDWTRDLFTMRVSPWPLGAQVAFALRHDVDRIPDKPILEKLLSAQVEEGIGVTAYFLGRTAVPEVIKAFAESGAEVAYHAEYLEPYGADELAKIEKIRMDRIFGCSVHGGTGFYGWRGVANWEVYQQLNFSYAENLTSMRYLPSRFYKFDDCGIASVYPFIGMPHHFSFERNKSAHFRERLVAAMKGIERNEVCIILLNHPDLHVPDLISFFQRDIPVDRADFTIKGIADWWNISHTQENLQYEIVRVEPHTLQLDIKSRNYIPGLTLEIPGQIKVKGLSIADQRSEQPLKHAYRSAHNALTGDCTRIWFDLPPGSFRLTLKLEERVPAVAGQAA